MKKLLTGLLAGILSFGSANSSQAQEKPSNGTVSVLLNNNYYNLEQQKGQFIKEKQSFDYLVEMEILSVIYSNQNQLQTVRGEDILYGDNQYTRVYTMKSSKGKITTEMGGFLGADEKGQYLKAYVSNDTTFPFAIRSYQEGILIGKPAQVNFSGAVADKVFALNVNYSNKQPIDASGNWGGLEIKVAYTPSKDVPWLIDHKDVQLTDPKTKIVTHYNVKYDFGELQTDNGKAISYTGFTVTKQ